MGLSHVAQLRISLCLLWRSFTSSDNTLLRTLLGAFRACPAPRRERRSRGDRPTDGSEVLPYFLGRCGRRWNAVPTAGSDRSVASPNGRAGARPSRCGRNKFRPSLGFGPVAGGFSLRNRVTKSRTRRCQRSILRSPSQFLSKGTRESISNSLSQRKRGF